ncbi:hypothetical protein HPB50_021476 [Hyalomma asiaticum]|uniref:Uncharacterized protein n=1 Tax=Hyalomma asiaticum TaxID=266040 RepID=A0ACB7SK55_HYAAI|nr:hypothetical protein HPB50_021476 [Hyalomma asiaticum]
MEGRNPQLLQMVLVVPGDVSVFADCENAVEKTVKHFGKIDILVNNAGGPGPGSLEKASVEDFNKAWRTNVGGPLCLMKNAMPYLRQTKETTAPLFIGGAPPPNFAAPPPS